MASAQVVKALATMGEIYGKSLSPAAAQMIAADLDGYPEHLVLAALGACRKELKFFPSLAEIISRIDDGRPGAEEAWAMIPKDEEGSVVWSDEMAEAFGIARPLLLTGDAIGARMAFKEKYQALVAQARDKRAPVRFTPSLGFDRLDQQRAVQEALDKKRITEAHAQALLPEYTASSSRLVLESGQSDTPGLTSLADIVKQLDDKREATD